MESQGEKILPWIRNFGSHQTWLEIIATAPWNGARRLRDIVDVQMAVRWLEDVSASFKTLAAAVSFAESGMVPDSKKPGVIEVRLPEGQAGIIAAAWAADFAGHKSFAPPAPAPAMPEDDDVPIRVKGPWPDTAATTPGCPRLTFLIEPPREFLSIWSQMAAPASGKKRAPCTVAVFNQRLVGRVDAGAPAHILAPATEAGQNSLSNSRLWETLLSVHGILQPPIIPGSGANEIDHAKYVDMAWWFDRSASEPKLVMVPRKWG
jgi:hypothetical protein